MLTKERRVLCLILFGGELYADYREAAEVHGVKREMFRDPMNQRVWDFCGAFFARPNAFFCPVQDPTGKSRWILSLPDACQDLVREHAQPSVPAPWHRADGNNQPGMQPAEQDDDLVAAFRRQLREQKMPAPCIVKLNDNEARPSENAKLEIDKAHDLPAAVGRSPLLLRDTIGVGRRTLPLPERDPQRPRRTLKPVRRRVPSFGYFC